MLALTLLGLTALAFVGSAPEVRAQGAADQDDGTIDMSARRWCADSGTACWTSPDSRGYFNGVRIVADFDLAYVFNRGRNRIGTSIQTLPKLAVELNLLDSWVAFQVALYAPGSVALDARSTAALQALSDTTRALVDYDYGYTVGLSFLDGSIALGYGKLSYDERQFRALQESSSLDSDSFFFMSLQTISTLRSSLKEVEGDAGGGE